MRRPRLGEPWSFPRAVRDGVPARIDGTRPGAALSAMPGGVARHRCGAARHAPTQTMVAAVSGDRALLLVRLKSRQPGGTIVGETRRTCHLVPVPDVATMPEFLTAYCGQRIRPEAGEVVPTAVGMPCEACLARSSIPAFAALRRLRRSTGEL